MTQELGSALVRVLEIGERAAPSHPTPQGGLALIVPKDSRVETLPPLDKLLTNIKQQVVVHDADSFGRYMGLFKGGDTRVFAEPGFLAPDGKARVVGIIDYHGAPEKTARAEHVITYTPRYSEQWERWATACTAPMRQAEFAEFIEETRADIKTPSAAQLLDIVRMFKANKQVEFDSLVHQPDSGVKLHYSEKVNQTGSSGVLPEQMILGIPVYFRDEPYAVPVFVRFRVSGGAVTFQLKIDRADVFEDEAFKKLVTRIGAATSLEPLLGRAR